MRTVGCFTDGHGRAALTAFSGLEVNGGAGRASLRPPGGPRAFPGQQPARDLTGGSALPGHYPGSATGPPDHGVSGTVGIQGAAVTERPRAPRTPSAAAIAERNYTVGFGGTIHAGSERLITR